MRRTVKRISWNLLAAAGELIDNVVDAGDNNEIQWLGRSAKPKVRQP